MSSITPATLFTHTEKEIIDMVKALKLAARCKFDFDDDSFDSSMYDDVDEEDQNDTKSTETEMSWNDETNLADVISNKQLVQMLKECAESEEKDEEEEKIKSPSSIPELYPFFYEEYINHDTIPLEMIITAEDTIIFQDFDDGTEDSTEI